MEARDKAAWRKWHKSVTALGTAPKPAPKPTKRPKPFTRWSVCALGHLCYDGKCEPPHWDARPAAAELNRRRVVIEGRR